MWEKLLQLHWLHRSWSTISDHNDRSCHSYAHARNFQKS